MLYYIHLYIYIIMKYTYRRLISLKSHIDLSLWLLNKYLSSPPCKTKSYTCHCNHPLANGSDTERDDLAFAAGHAPNFRFPYVTTRVTQFRLPVHTRWSAEPRRHNITRNDGYPKAKSNSNGAPNWPSVFRYNHNNNWKTNS